MRVLSDFDGTIAAIDTTDLVLNALALPEWEEVEARWLAGEITAAECMRLQVAMIQGSEDDLNAVLDRVELTPGFLEFARWCAARKIPLTVVSDGVDRFLNRILGRHGLGHLPIISNKMAGYPGARRLEQPWRRTGCAAGSGVCKCAVLEAEGHEGPTVFIGDGRSDFCVSGKADILFAKYKLADYARQRGMDFVEFDTFYEVIAELERIETAPKIPAFSLA